MFLSGDILLKSEINNYNIEENVVSEKVKAEDTSGIKDDNGAYEYIPGDKKPIMASSQSAKNIVDNAMQSGYTAEEATVVYRAQKAYDANSAKFKTTQGNNSSYRSYTVSD